MKLLSIREVGQVLGVSPATAHRLVTSGALPSLVIRSGRRKKLHRVRQEALNQWVAARERENTRAFRASRGRDDGIPEGSSQAVAASGSAPKA